MSGKRWDHGIAIVDQVVYVVGGKNWTEVFTSCKRYQVKDDCWEAIAELNQARWNCTAQAMPNGKVYVFGGQDGSKE